MRLELTATAQRDIHMLPALIRGRIVKKLQFFAEQPNPLAYAVRLTGFTKGGDYRFRTGNYRAVFDVTGKTIYILYIEHRRDIYRR